MTAKPRILLVPNASSWILGDIATQIMQSLGDDYEFRYLSELTARFRPALLRRVLREVDAVHAFTEVIARTVHRLAGPELPPLVTWIHHVSEWREEHTFAIERSDRVIASTAEWAQVVQAHAKTGPIPTVGYGVDSERFRRTAPMRAAFGIPENAFAVGFVGSRFSDLDAGRKGLDVLETVIGGAAVAIPDFHILFVGPGWDADAARLRAAGISASAVGYVPAAALPAAYSSIDAYLVTSRVEGGPCTVLEAMACETPVVSTRVGLVPEVMTGALARFTTAVDDARALTAALVDIAAMTGAERQHVGEAARGIVTSVRRWDQTLRSLRPVYDSMVGSRTVANPARTRGADVWAEFGAIAAADAMIGTAHSLLSRSASIGASARAFRSMLAGRSTRDVARGAGLLGARLLGA